MSPNQSSPSGCRATICTSSIDLGTKMTSSDQVSRDKVEAFVSALDGVIGVSSLSAARTGNCQLTIQHKSNGMPLRGIVRSIKNFGYRDATYIARNGRENNSLNDVLVAEFDSYANKFKLAMMVQLPILLLMWVVPYIRPDYLDSPVTLFYRPLYIVLLLGLSFINQFVLGASFY